jgi:ubiquitin C-terminal hydrolase
LCNYSLFCCEECSKISGGHNNLHEILDQIYIKKIDILSVLNQELKLIKENPKGLVGLTKEKQFSGINSIIQCLSNSIDFTKYFINNVYINDLSIIDYLTNKETFAFKYYNLIKEMWTSTKINQNLDAYYKDFIRLLLNDLKIKSNDIIAMNDITRILDFLLNNFHKELNRCVNVEKANNNNEKEEKGAEHYLNQNQSIITDLFQGIFQSVLHCSKCGNVTIIYSPFNTILLPMPKKNNNLSIKYH